MHKMKGYTRADFMDKQKWLCAYLKMKASWLYERLCSGSYTNCFRSMKKVVKK